MVLDDRRKMFIGFMSHVLCFGLALDLFYIFIRAFLNDNVIEVKINSYGEAAVELVLIPVTLVFCLVGLWFAWKYLKKHFLKEN